MEYRLVRVGHKSRPPSLSTSRAKRQCCFCPISGLSHATGRHVFVEAASRLDFIARGRRVCLCIPLDDLFGCCMRRVLAVDQVRAICSEATGVWRAPRRIILQLRNDQNVGVIRTSGQLVRTTDTEF